MLSNLFASFAADASRSNRSVRRRQLSPASALALLAGVTISVSVIAADPPKDAELLRDFVHYVKIDRSDLAKNFGEALLKRLAPPIGSAEGEGAISLSAFVDLVENNGGPDRFTDAAATGTRNAELESVAGRLLRAYYQGKLEQARDPAQIAKNISLLTQGQLQRQYARERLAYAGEYALPQLLPVLARKGDPALSAEVRQLLVDMGRQSIMPLLAALPKLDPTAQEQVAKILGEIPYRISIPALVQVYNSAQIDSVRSACERAVTRIGGSFDAGMDVSAAYADIARAFYNQEESLLAFKGEQFQLVWSYDPSIGLIPMPVDTRVWHEAMAMNMAEEALKADRSNGDAVALWLGANFSRELDTPEGYENPVYPKDRRDATYYAVAAGARPTQNVLATAIDGRRTQLARKAIAAIEQTAGASLLADVSMGRNPLLECLRYPNRRVQYEAALALAIAQPANSFDGSERVVPLLGSCIRDASAKYGVVIASSKERENSLGNVLRGLGYTVLPGGTSLSDAESAIVDAPGIDVIIADLPGPSADALINEVRGNARLAAAPILALCDAKAMTDLGSRHSRDEAVRLIRSGTDPAQQAEAVKQLVDRASGGAITDEEVTAYQTKALQALRDLAVSGNPTLNPADAAGALVTALGQAKGAMRMRIAEVMSRIGDKRAQTALMDAALAAQAEEMIDLLGKVTQSAKKYGNMLDDRQIRRLVEMAGAGTDAEATAKAALIGALNLSSDNIVPMILSGSEKKS
ncbi:MAG: hypothetical protein AB7K52_02490 [Phycisphaerales bacterium]